MLNLAERLDECEVRYKGKHPVVKVPGKGSMPIPNRKVGKGLFAALKRQWLALGLPILILSIIYHEEISSFLQLLRQWWNYGPA